MNDVPSPKIAVPLVIYPLKPVVHYYYYYYDFVDMPLGWALLGSRMCTTVFTDTNECPCARILLIPVPFQIAPHVFHEFPLQLLLTEEVHHFLDDVHSEPRSVPEVQSLNLIFGSSYNDFKISSYRINFEIKSLESFLTVNQGAYSSRRQSICDSVSVLL